MASRREGLLVLFDGNALLYRAFHALPPLSTRTGEPVGAVYGFVSMLLKALNELKPAYWAVAFDSPGPTFRHQKFEQYKAHRPKPPDELRRQTERVRRVAQAFGIPKVELAGFEADDILGTLSRLAEERGLETIIVTGDADTMQLVSPHVKILLPKPRSSFGDTVLYDVEMVKRQYGLLPSQIPDYKALAGDPSDNIPGVPGIGEKTAKMLLREFGSLEAIYENLHRVNPPKLRELLRAYEEKARLSKELALIRRDLPLDFEPEEFAVERTYSREGAIEIFRELEFVSLLPKLPKAPKAVLPAGEEIRYKVVDTPEALEEMLEALSRSHILALSTEAAGPDLLRAELSGIALSAGPDSNWYIPLKRGAQLPPSQVIEKLKLVLEDPKILKVAHDAKRDMMALCNCGIDMREPLFDTMIAAHLVGEKALELKNLAFTRLGIEPGREGEDRARRACADAEVIWKLREILEAELREKGLWRLFSEIEIPLIRVLLKMERNGILVDVNKLREMSRRLREELFRLEEEIYKLVGFKFNINSPQQLAQVLYERLKLPRSRRTKTGYSTEASVLESLRGAHPVIDLLLRYRQLSKLRSTYVDALPGMVNPKTGRIHTTFHQTGTVTGRLSSSDPNLQNIPVRGEEGGRIREAFVSEEGFLFLGADYSQIELRVMAHFSRDPKLVEAFLRDEDIHAATASEVFGVPVNEITPEMRRAAKVVNFGVIYGISEYGLEQAAGLSREQASELIRKYFEKYQGVKEYIERSKRQAQERGYVETLLGRRRYLPEMNSPNPQVRQAAERMAVNMPIQGTAAEIIKIAMIRIDREMERRGLRSRMLLQVHDELLFEVPEEELSEMKELVPALMSTALELCVPLKVDIGVGRTWAEVKG